jgi:hypothetical protein
MAVETTARPATRRIDLLLDLGVRGIVGKFAGMARVRR